MLATPDLESVKTALASAGTCTRTTAEHLSIFLNGATTAVKESSTRARLQDGTRVTRDPTPATSRRAKSTNTAASDVPPPLKPSERLRLATEAVNICLKSLGQEVQRRTTPIQTDTVKKSVPASPLAVRSINIPPIPVKDVKSNATSAEEGSKVLAECARLALASLRKAGETSTAQSLPPLQVESAMSALISKLIALDIVESACKEIRILASRLSMGNANEPSAKRVKRPDTTQVLPPLADLLLLHNHPDSPQKLSLVLATQLHILKLVTTTKAIPSLSSLLLTLTIDSTSSPFLLIEAMLLTDGNDKCGRQLIQFARAVLAVADRVSMKTTGESTSISTIPTGVLRLRALSLVYLWRGWDLVGHKADLQAQVFRPLKNYLQAYLSQTSDSASERLTVAETVIATILSPLHSAKLSSDQLEQIESAELEIDQLLHGIAKASGNNKKTKQYANKSASHLKNANISKTRRATILCQQAISYLKSVSTKVDPNEENPIQDAIDSLTDSLDGASADLDELMVCASSLRKVAFKSLSQIASSKSEEPQQQNLLAHLILEVLTFKLRYLGSPPNKQTGSAYTRYEERWRLASTVARATIESVAALTRWQPREFTNSKQYQKALRDCVTLAKRLDLDQTEPANDTNHTPILILISNVYWSHYLTSRQSDAVLNDQIKLLEQSEALLQDLETAEQKIGLHHHKLERLAYLQEQRQDWNSAQKIYQGAFTLLERFGILHQAAEIVRWMPDRSVLSERAELKVLGKIIDGHTRVSAHLEDSKDCLLYCTQDTPLLQGLIHELQLESYMRQDSAVRGCRPIFQRLAEAIRTTYDATHYPIRRLRAIVSLAECNVPLVHEEEEECMDLELNAEEKSLLPFHDHLLARRNAILAIKQMKNSRLLSKALEQWVAIVSHKSITSFSLLKTKIDIVQNWHTLLTTIANFSAANGLIEQRIIALDLLSYTLRLSQNFDQSALGPTVCGLAEDLLSLDCSTEALQALKTNSSGLDSNSCSTSLALERYIAEAECQIAIGGFEPAGLALSKADSLLCARMAESESVRTQDMLLLRGKLAYVSSKYYMYSGNIAESLYAIKRSTRFLLQTWSLKHRRNGIEITNSSQTKTSPLTQSGDLIVEHSSVSFVDSEQTCNTSHLWSVVQPLFKSLNFAAEVLLYAGLVSEGRYYGQEALRIAEKVDAAAFKIQALSLLAELEAQCGNTKPSEKLYEQTVSMIDASKHIGPTQLAILRARLLTSSAAQRTEGNLQALDSHSKSLEDLKTITLLSLRWKNVSSSDLTDQMAKLKLENGNSRRVKAPVAKNSKTNLPIAPQNPDETHQDNAPLNNVRTKLAMAQAQQLLSQQQYVKALQVINAYTTSSALGYDSQKALLQTKLHLQEGLKALEFDPVYSIVADATLAQPIVTRSDITTFKGKVSRANKQTPAATKRSKQTLARPVYEEHFSAAIKASTSLDKAHSGHYSTADDHLQVDLRVKGSLTYSAVMPADPGSQLDTNAGSILERSRITASVRGQAAIKADMSSESSKNGLSAEASQVRIDDVSQLDDFQADYIDIIPANWHVASLSLSEDGNELRLGCFRAKASPLVLSIPLNRQSRDGDDHGFTSQQGKKELHRIIDLANYSSHEGVDPTKKGAKAEWWEARAALDSRLRDLLINIETLWLGGFKGLLRHCSLDDTLNLEFSKTLSRILDKHLPTRQGRNTQRSNPTVLDQKIVELFLRLDISAANESAEESILDLLYFILDVLWFNGERNASDEMDLDPMVLEVREALDAHHDKLNLSSTKVVVDHTILILDRRLHAFPWESLPCLNGQSVSRLPSLHCLRERVLHMQRQKGTENSAFLVDATNGSYILNPSGDLKNTQKAFQQSLANLNGWSSRVNTIPTEDDIANALSDKSLYLYFGHGSGAQYIRSRTVRRLDRCAVALLMGCSSASLTEAGCYESFGTPLNYLNAGAPAVVGTLWDVTDKDIDRFSMNMLRKWGLFDGEDVTKTETAKTPKKSSKARGKQKQKDVQELDSVVAPPVSLDAAVAQARNACIMRYLNGAAPVVYGIPVSLH